MPPQLVTLPYLCETKRPEDATSSENDLTNNEDAQTADASTDQTQAHKANAGNAPIDVTLR